MSLMEWLGRQAASEKQASTALVRSIRKGLLSAPTIERAATGMAPGKFRFLGNLGRGQFSLADKVVGNVGGHAGEMVRKIPTRQSTMLEQFSGPAKATEYLNKRFTPAGADPVIAPFHDINAKGAFQSLAHGKTTVPNEMSQLLSDLHPANRGPGGQLMDFRIPNVSDPDFKNFILSNKIDDAPWNPLIDQRHAMPGIGNSRLRDTMGNIQSHSPGGALDPAMLQKQRESNNMIRKYWGMSEEQRPGFLRHLRPETPPPSSAQEASFNPYISTVAESPGVPMARPSWLPEGVPTDRAGIFKPQEIRNLREIQQRRKLQQARPTIPQSNPFMTALKGTGLATGTAAAGYGIHKANQMANQPQPQSAGQP